MNDPHTTTENETFQGSHEDVVETLVELHRKYLDFLQRRVGHRALAEDLL